MKVRAKDAAEQQGVTLSELQRRTLLPMTLIRRYWYGTRSGSPQGEPLTEVSLRALQTICRALNASPGDVLFIEDGEEDEGNKE